MKKHPNLKHHPTPITQSPSPKTHPPSPNTQHLKPNGGFTLIEMIATVSIFVIVITIATGVLVTIIKTQRKNNAQRIIQQESKNVLETITREAKLVAGSDSYPPFTVGNKSDSRDNAYTWGNQLTLTNGSDIKTYFLDSEAGYGIVRLTEELDAQGKPDLTKAHNITSENVNVTELKFEVSSKSVADTAAGKTQPEVQPFVNISLSLESRKDTPATRAKATLKTTASSLKYICAYAQSSPPGTPPIPIEPPPPPGPGACSPPIVIDPTPTSWSYDTSIATDSQNKVHISYRQVYFNESGDLMSDLKYATNVSGEWVYTFLDSGTYTIYNSIAIDSNNKIHISYYNNDNFDLKYATNVSGEWVYTTLDSEGDVGSFNSIAIDSKDKVHISYWDKTNGCVKYATNASGEWVYTSLDPGKYTGGTTSIAIDSKDKMHISYGISSGPSGYDLRYATNASGEWVYTSLDLNSETFFHHSIAIDSKDKVHISYCDDKSSAIDPENIMSDLKYATNVSGEWVYETLDVGNLGRFNSIAIDSQDKVHISYWDLKSWTDPNFDLKYATNVSGEWVDSILDPDSRGYTSIAVDSTDLKHISYIGYGADDSKLKYTSFY